LQDRELQKGFKPVYYAEIGQGKYLKERKSCIKKKKSSRQSRTVQLHAAVGSRRAVESFLTLTKLLYSKLYANTDFVFLPHLVAAHK
jgi:hypothetical protein